MHEFLRVYRRKSYVLDTQKKYVSQLSIILIGIIITFYLTMFLFGKLTIMINVYFVILLVVITLMYTLLGILHTFPNNKKKYKYLLHPFKLLNAFGYKEYRKEKQIVKKILNENGLDKCEKQYNTIIEYLEKIAQEKRKQISPVEIYSLLISIISIGISIFSLLKLDKFSNIQILSYILLTIFLIFIGFCIFKLFKTDIKFIYDSVIEKQIDYQLLLDIMYDLKLEYYKIKES